MGAGDGRAAMGGAAASAVEREHVALCLAEQVVRVRLAAARLAAQTPGGRDVSWPLLEPLLRAAAALGLRERVLALADEALAVHACAEADDAPGAA
jgi:hypothetical protein